MAASLLGIERPGLDKLIRAGLLGNRLHTEDVTRLVDPLRTGALTGRPLLQLTDGEATVLRTNARVESDPARYGFLEPRKWIGFHVDHSDTELAESSLRWWRCDANRVVANQIYIVTVATYPVAVYQITAHTRSVTLPGETATRHGFDGKLLARLRPGLTLGITPNLATTLHDTALQVMTSRIIVQSGGPIGYLTAPHPTASP